MAYRVNERLPKGGAKNYIDTNTGEVISARQYRNFQAQSKGFPNLSQQQKAAKYTVDKHEKVKTVWHTYDIGLPKNRRQAINHTIDKSPHFGYGMMLAMRIIIYTDNGEEYERVVGTTVYKKDKREVRKMLEELYQFSINYGERYKILTFYVIMVDDL